jgi:hypothetical protein
MDDRRLQRLHGSTRGGIKMEKTELREKKVTKEGRLVTPLDEPRSLDRGHAIIGATQTSGLMYTMASGKQGYIKQLIVTELSGADSRVWLSDSSGYITPPIIIGANTTVTFDNPGLITYGNIWWQTEAGNHFYGRGTLTVQIDPQRIE